MEFDITCSNDDCDASSCVSVDECLTADICDTGDVFSCADIDASAAGYESPKIIKLIGRSIRISNSAQC